MRHKQPLLLLSLLIPLTGFSQEKFIEVTVSDTVWAKPNQFVYTITVNPAIEFAISDSMETYERRKFLSIQKKKDLLDSFATALAAKGFRIFPTPVEEVYSNYDERRYYSIHIYSQSMDSIKMLHNSILDNPSFYGGISTVRASNEDGYNKILFQKILAKAKIEANTIAEISKMKVGSILLVKEWEPETKYGSWTAYPPLSSIATIAALNKTIPSESLKGSNNTITDLYKIEKTLVVRFAVQ